LAFYLEFEKKIERLAEEVELSEIRKDFHAAQIKQEELDQEVAKTFKNLSDFQKLQLARHPDRPYSLDYIQQIMTDSYEIKGDRHYRDDPSIVCYIGKIGDVACVIIGEEKGRGTKNKIARNFGMPHPEGYRKALRVAQLAEKFNLPILFLIDTPGAYPGLGAEERGQSEAIAKNLYELSKLNTITVSVVIGEGGSGGALAIGVADKLAMMRYSVFSVISPEGCAAILWNDPTKVETATQALRITPDELKANGLIDDIIDEPLIGAHRDKISAGQAIAEYFLGQVGELSLLDKDDLLARRYKKLENLGKFEEVR
jgi:acetyl-CoA carboxylase carboxyl transferase subunit alpha